MKEPGIRIYMIRHGRTYGNSLFRYIGRTDEPLMEGEAERIAGLSETYRRLSQIPPKAETVFVSPMIRCRQTAGLFYPDAEQLPVEDLRECDFGRFENRNYMEMEGDPEYQAWIDSNATLPFPGGESPEGFTARSVRGFRSALSEALRRGMKEIVFFVHGGTIMSVLYSCAESDRAYYDWHVQNAEGYSAILDAAAFHEGRAHFLTETTAIREDGMAELQ